MTAESFLPFASPEIGEDEIAEVVDCLRSGWITTGRLARQFETDFSEYLGGGVTCLSVNSATAGLHLALEAGGVRPGDEVITTSLTFTATAEVARYLGAEVRFADIDEQSLNIDHNSAAALISERTRAILPVHYGGLACEMDAILRLANENGLIVVEDAAHALPTTYKGELVGTLGSLATVFSFYANKTITTGEGGMLVTRNPEVAERASVMRLHGIDRDAFDRFSSKVPSWYYEVIAPGFKYNLTDIAAALGIHQLRRLPAFHTRREELASRYDAALRELPLILPSRPPIGNVHAWHLYVVRLTDDAPVARDDLIEILAKKGIGTSVHYIPLHRQPYWRDRYQLRPEDFPNCEKAWQSMISLPLYTRMTDGEQNRVIDGLHEILG